MIQTLPQKTNPKQTAQKTQNQASSSNKKILASQHETRLRLESLSLG